MTPIVTSIYAAIFLSGALGVYLKRRQAASVAAHRAQVPSDFAGQVSLADHQRAADYTLANIALRAGDDSL